MELIQSSHCTWLCDGIDFIVYEAVMNVYKTKYKIMATVWYKMCNSVLSE